VTFGASHAAFGSAEMPFFHTALRLAQDSFFVIMMHLRASGLLYDQILTATGRGRSFVCQP
jgi:hypothetical protein